MENRNNPILLTGSHRSGTTWAGKIISASKSVAYIMEPFNDANNRPGIFREKFGYYFPYIDDKNSDQYSRAVWDTLNFKYNLICALESVRSAYDLARLLKDFIFSTWFSVSKKRPFIKDPNALFMAEWIHKRFDVDIIILIRHPAAFVSSLMLLQWYFPFGDIMKQKNLMETYLSRFNNEIRLFKNKRQRLIDEAILAWCLIHHTIYNYKIRYKDWIFVRHEDLSRSPEEEFRNIFLKINIDFDCRVKKRLNKLTSTQNPSDTTNLDIPVSSRKSIKRNSQSNIWNWKNRLDSDQIAYIRDRVEPISSQFYNDQDW